MPSGDVDAWRKAIEKIVAQPALGKEMGQRGGAYLERCQNYTLWCAALESAIRAAMCA